MPRLTISLPDELLKDFRENFPEINVAEIARRAIKKKVAELEELEKLKELKAKEKNKWHQ